MTSKITRKITFSQLTGRSVKVAIIDSGIEAEHPKIGRVAGGVGFTVGSDGQTMMQTDHTDCVGHGTACAGIIHNKAPDAELYSVRIFDETLSANGHALVAAIQWATEQRVDIINFSLGTTDVAYKDVITEACQYAIDAGVILIASEHNRGLPSYPANMPNVIGVTGGEIYDRYGYYYSPDGAIECVARGDEQRVCWKDGREIMTSGTSYAAPHITGIVALIKEVYPKATQKNVREILKANAITKRTEPVRNTAAQIAPSFSVSEKSGISNYSWIKKAALYPYNKEMHAFIRFRDLLHFEITSVADPVGKGFVGKDPGEVIGTESIGFKIVSNLQKALRDADTLILGYVDQLGRISKRDLLRESIQMALDQGVHIFSFLPLPQGIYRDLYAQAKKKGLRIVYPSISLGEVQNIIKRNQKSIPFDVPVLSIFGTSSQQGKFTLQLALRRQLIQMGYKVGQIGTEHHSALFGMDLAFPMGYASPLDLPLQVYVPYLDHKMREISQKKQPDIILVGSQSGTIPYDVNEHKTHSLASIAFMLGTKPDACMLAVNSIDSDEYIQDTIDAIRTIGKIPTILLAMSDKEKHIRVAYGRTMINPQQMSRERIDEKLQYLEQTFSLPAVEIVSQKGQKKMLETVLQFFATSTDKIDEKTT